MTNYYENYASSTIIIGSLLSAITYKLINFYRNRNNLIEYIDISNRTDLLKNHTLKKNGIQSVDHIYILNLEKNKHKKEIVKTMIERKLDINIIDDNFFYGMYGSAIKNSQKELIELNYIDKDYLKCFPLKPFYFNDWSAPGCLGHYISFYQIFKNAIHNNLDYFMIVEDDAIFDDNLKTYLTYFQQILEENDYDFISLGQSNYFYNCNKNLLSSNKSIFNKNNYQLFKIEDSTNLFQQTHTMLLKKKSLFKFIDNYFPMKCPTDVMLGNISRKFKTDITNSLINQISDSTKFVNGLFVYPSLSKQSLENESDIEHWSNIIIPKIL